MSLRIRRGTEAQRTYPTFDSGELIFTTDTKQLWIGDGVTPGGSPIVGSNITGYGLTFNASSKRIEVAGLTADDISDGVNNKFFSTDLAQDATAALFAAGTHTNISFQYDDTLNKINATVTLDGIGLTDIVADTSPQLGGDLDLNSSDITGAGNINITGDITGVGNVTVSGIFDNSVLTIDNDTITSESSILTFGASTTPIGFIINSSADIDGCDFRSVTSPSAGPNIAFSAVRGSIVSPTVVTVGDTVGQIRFQGYQNTPVGFTQANLVTINSVLTVAGDGDTILPRGKLQFLVANGPNPANAATAEFDKDGVFSAPRFSAGDGTASVPSIVFTTDGSTDSGFFHPGDGVVCVSTDGTERVRIDNGGMRVEGFMKVKDLGAGALPNPPEAGMIVLQGGTFQGYNGTAWVNLS